MNALIILQSQKWGLSFLDRSTIETVLILNKKGIIKHIQAACITPDSNILQYALSLGIDNGIQINNHATTPFDQATLIKPYTNNIDCIFLSDRTDIYGNLGHILAGMLHWQYINNMSNGVPKQCIISLSNPIPHSHPSITDIMNTKPISIQDSTTHDNYKVLQQNMKKPLNKLFYSADLFIQQLVEDGILL